MARLTTSGLRRAKMAKVESLSHKHLVVLESTGTALQPRADQEPSNDELRSGDTQERGMRSNPCAIKQLFSLIQCTQIPPDESRSARKDSEKTDEWTM